MSAALKERIVSTLFADGVVRFEGEVVAAVAAQTAETAAAALELIHVDFEPLAPVTDPEAALQPGSQLVHPDWSSYHAYDGLVRNGNDCAYVTIAKGDVASFDRVIATNLRGAFLVLGQAARHISEGGRIIAFSSSVLAKAFPTYGPYIASKAGVEGLVHVLANELRGRNVTVNAVAPGPVATELFLNDKTSVQIEQLSKLPPLERLGQPEDIANVVSFLAGPDGGWVNGQVLRINGGFA